MDEETIIPPETLDSVSTEPPADPTESTAAEIVPETEPSTVPEETTIETTVEAPGDFIPDVTDVQDDYYWDDIPNDLDPEETTETIAEVVEVIDYTPAIGEATSIIANIILCGALMIVGVLTGIRLWR